MLSRHDVKRVERKRRTTDRTETSYVMDVEGEKCIEKNGTQEDKWSEYDFDADLEDGTTVGFVVNLLCI